MILSILIGTGHYGKIIFRMNNAVETGMIVPPRLFHSLKAGFDAVASHIGLILFPIALDALLWFGYHLRISSWLTPIVESYLKYSSVTASAEFKDFITAMQQSWMVLAKNFNLFSFLRSYPLGIPSLLTGIQPATTPLGQAPMIDFHSSMASFGVMVLFTVIGILLGAQYYYMVSRVANRETEKVDLKILLSILWQALCFSLVFYIALAVISLPFLMIVGVLMLISPALGLLGMMALMFLSVWLALPLVFSTHGIFTYRQPFRISLANSIRLGRYASPQVATFAIVIVTLVIGLNYLWSIPSEDDWLLLVGIVGHAFVSTGLLAGSFIYYRSATRWVQEIIQHRLAAQKTSI